jgi:alkylation response protein AidB-like acyl-CoA dehydrogenase
MAIGLTEEHEALADAVRGWAERYSPVSVVRATLDAGEETRPGFWGGLAEQGLLGLHVPEEFGGQGAGLLELAVALETLGRALVPGPFLPTVLASAALLKADESAKARKELLPGLADGSMTGALSLVTGLTGRSTDSGLTISGAAEPVLGGAVADVIVLPVSTDEGERWVAAAAAELTVTPLDSLDRTRRVARVEASDVVVPADRILTGLEGEEVLDIASLLLGAEAAGIAAWCVDTAAEYAKVREQFGRPIGQFQGVKHKCARMLIELEKARAVVWDAARASDDTADESGFAAGVAAVIAPDAALGCARDCIQVLGGIGFTWEHEAGLYLRRASTLRVLLGPARDWAGSVATLALDGVRRAVEVELDEDTEPLRNRIRAGVAELAAIGDNTARFARMGDEGWVFPHLPKPWGKAASPMEQVLILQELRAAKVRGPQLGIGAWVVPSLVTYGTPEQQERFLAPTLRGEMAWCQLFSEPGAGSDLASLQMKAERVEGAAGRSHGGETQGGWKLTGQKIWTSVARQAEWAICIARSSVEPKKHDGITYFIVDMKSEGVDVRPLRELTGEAMFNEVFLDEVFVPDDRVVGEVGQGWKVARNTLSNERVQLSSGSGSLGAGTKELLEFFKNKDLDPAQRTELGEFICEGQAIDLLGLRLTLKQISGHEPGAEASVRKLLGVQYNQQVADFIWESQGAAGALEDMSGPTGLWARYMLFSRSMTIYGGTTEVQLNVIAERMLGLPRDPEPGK